MYYSKIETPFERDMDGSRRLIPGKYRNPAVRAVCDLPWEWTLKVDGTSVLIAWDGHEVSIHGHTERSCLQVALVERLKSLFLGETAAQLFEQKFGATPAFLYGEGVGPKIQACGFHYGDAPDFILFDALAVNARNRTSTKLSERIASAIRDLYESGCASQQRLADAFGVARRTVRDVCSGRHWAPVETARV